MLLRTLRRSRRCGAGSYHPGGQEADLQPAVPAGVPGITLSTPVASTPASGWLKGQVENQVGGCGSASSPTRAYSHNGARGRFFHAVDLINKLDVEARNGRQGRMADYLGLLDFVVLDE